MGSASNLSSRLRRYYSEAYMTGVLKRSNSNIFSAILKTGIENFSLTVLEYCLPEKQFEREEYYLNQLKDYPKYNILEKPGSLLGYKHSEETRAKMSNIQKVIDRSGKNNPMYGKTKIKGAGKPVQKISVTDTLTNSTKIYESISVASKALGIRHSSISNYFRNNKKKLFKGRYIFEKIV